MNGVLHLDLGSRHRDEMVRQGLTRLLELPDDRIEIGRTSARVSAKFRLYQLYIQDHPPADRPIDQARAFARSMLDEGTVWIDQVGAAAIRRDHQRRWAIVRTLLQETGDDLDEIRGVSHEAWGTPRVTRRYDPCDPWYRQLVLDVFDGAPRMVWIYIDSGPRKFNIRFGCAPSNDLERRLAMMPPLDAVGTLRAMASHGHHLERHKAVARTAGNG